MLRTTSGLSRPVLKWVSQVTASLGATLAATLIWSAVPHPAASPATPPEMTSGGKFAARAVDAVAYDGLDTMPVPRVAPAPAVLAAKLQSTASTDVLQRSSWDGASPLVLAPERPARAARPVRAPARHASMAEVPQRVPAAALPTAAPEAAEEESFLPRVMPKIVPALASTARDAWAVTASAGESLVARVVPQIP